MCLLDSENILIDLYSCIFTFTFFFSMSKVDEMYREAPIDKNGMFNYLEFTRILKHGAKDKDDQ